MTEKDDVELWRVKVLLATNNAVGIAPHVLSLLSVYKLYRPDLVAVSLPSTQRVRSFSRSVGCENISGTTKLETPDASGIKLLNTLRKKTRSSFGASGGSDCKRPLVC